MFNWFRPSKHQPSAPTDFAAIDSLQKAQELHRLGKLTRIYLFPPDLGGQESEMNAVYVTAEAALLKARFDALVEDLLRQDLVEGYSASPEYKGKSFIPCALVLKATGTGGIEERIEIW